MPTIINSLNNESGGSNPGVTNLFTVFNSDNTNAASHAQHLLSVGGASSGNPWQQWSIGTARSYSFGITNTTGEESMRLNTAASGSVSPITGTNIWNMRTTGARTMPLQPAFYAINETVQNNVTGDGTLYDVSFNSESFDQGSNYANPNFTAPVTGIYWFLANINFINLDNTFLQGFVSFVINSIGYTTNGYMNIAAVLNSPANAATLPCTALLHLTAGDTVKVQVQVTGSTKTVGIGTGFSAFSGFLVC